MLIAHLKNDSFREVDVEGTVPSDENILRRLAHSGFFQYVKSPLKHIRPDTKIYQKQGRKVDQDSICELIKFASQKIYGDNRRMPGPYRILVEAMANTYDHATLEKEEKESWWAIVGYDQTSQRVRFCLFDMGVGIFGSAKLRWFRDRFPIFFRAKNNSNVLREMLEGELSSRTGIPYRGKGLPAMKMAYMRGQIRGLTIAANDAFIRVEENECFRLSPPLNGTYISWEVDKDCA